MLHRTPKPLPGRPCRYPTGHTSRPLSIWTLGSPIILVQSMPLLLVLPAAGAAVAWMPATGDQPHHRGALRHPRRPAENYPALCSVRCDIVARDLAEENAWLRRRLRASAGRRGAEHDRGRREGSVVVFRCRWRAGVPSSGDQAWRPRPAGGPSPERATRTRRRANAVAAPRPLQSTRARGCSRAQRISDFPFPLRAAWLAPTSWRPQRRSGRREERQAHDATQDRARDGCAALPSSELPR